jgi:hypothetical protein
VDETSEQPALTSGWLGAAWNLLLPRIDKAAVARQFPACRCLLLRDDIFCHFSAKIESNACFTVV